MGVCVRAWERARHHASVCACACDSVNEGSGVRARARDAPTSSTAASRCARITSSLGPPTAVRARETCAHARVRNMRTRARVKHAHTRARTLNAHLARAWASARVPSREPAAERWRSAVARAAQTVLRSSIPRARTLCLSQWAWARVCARACMCACARERAGACEYLCVAVCACAYTSAHVRPC